MEAYKQQERNQSGFKTAVNGIIINSCLAAGKITTGLLSGSVSVVADGFNNVSDVFASAISVICFKIMSKPADAEHPFGHARVEYISASVIAMLMFLLVFQLFGDSITAIRDARRVDLSHGTLFILIASIAVKGFLFFYYRQKAKKIDSLVLKASSIDSANDFFATLLILLALVFGQKLPFAIDGILGILVALLILRQAIGILHNTFNHLIGIGADGAFEQKIKEFITASEDKVLGVHNIMVYDYGPGATYLSGHIEMDSQTSFDDAYRLTLRLENLLLHEYNVQAVLKADPVMTGNENYNRLRDIIARVAEEIGGVDCHGLNYFPERGGGIVIFDIMVDEKAPQRDARILHAFREAIKKEFGELAIEINLEHQYAKKVYRV